MGRTSSRIKGVFIADYFCVCGICDTEKAIGARDKPAKAARELGYVYRKGIGWVCPDCKKTEPEKSNNSKKLTKAEKLEMDREEAQQDYIDTHSPE